MADEPLGKEFVEFEATGLDELLGDVNKLEEAVKRSYSAFLQQKDALADPAWRQHSEDLHRIKTATDDATKSEKARVEQVERARRLVSGEFIAGKRRENTGRLADTHYQIRARSDLLASGEHLRARRIASDSTAAAAAMTLRERSAALKSGQYGRESHQANALTLQAGQQDIAERSMLLKSGAYLENRENDGRLVAANGVLGLRERKAALAGGTFGRESHRANLIEEGGGRLANRERASLLASGEYTRAAGQRQMLDQEREMLHLAERRAKLASGLFVGGAAGDQRLAKERELLRLAERRAKLSSGLFAADVQQRAFLGEQARLMDHQERRAELRALHGRLGGTAMYGLERARPAMLAAAGVGAVGLGMAKSGLSGTVEGNALAMEMHLLNREMAGAILPAVRDLTRALRWVRQKAEKLTGGQQDVLGYGALAAVGGAGLLATAGIIGNSIGGIKTLLATLGVRAGTSAAASMASQAAATAAGQIAGNAASGVVGNVVGGAAGGAAASRLGGAARFGGSLLGRVAAPLAVAATAWDMGKDIGTDTSTLRALFRQGPVRAADMLFGGEGARLLGFKSGGPMGQAFDAVFGGNDKRNATTQGKPSDPHRLPMQAGAAFSDFDTVYKEVSNAVADRAAQRENGPSMIEEAFDGVEKKLDQVWEWLKSVVPSTSLR